MIFCRVSADTKTCGSPLNACHLYGGLYYTKFQRKVKKKIGHGFHGVFTTKDAKGAEKYSHEFHEFLDADFADYAEKYSREEARINTNNFVAVAPIVLLHKNLPASNLLPGRYFFRPGHYSSVSFFPSSFARHSLAFSGLPHAS